MLIDIPRNCVGCVGLMVLTIVICKLLSIACEYDTENIPCPQIISHEARENDISIPCPPPAHRYTENDISMGRDCTKH